MSLANRVRIPVERMERGVLLCFCEGCSGGNRTLNIFKLPRFIGNRTGQPIEALPMVKRRPCGQTAIAEEGVCHGNVCLLSGLCDWFLWPNRPGFTSHLHLVFKTIEARGQKCPLCYRVLPISLAALSRIRWPTHAEICIGRGNNGHFCKIYEKGVCIHAGELAPCVRYR